MESIEVLSNVGTHGSPVFHDSPAGNSYLGLLVVLSSVSERGSQVVNLYLDSLKVLFSVGTVALKLGTRT